MLKQEDLLLILEMRFNSLDWTIKQSRNGKLRADCQIRQQEVHFLIEHVKNIIGRNENNGRTRE